MRGDKYPNHTLGAWKVDAKSEPHSVDNDSLGVRGLKLEGMIDGEVTARTVTVDALETEDTTTERQAFLLRQIGMKALADELNLVGESFDDVSLVLSELISNAQRHSESGPLEVSLVRLPNTVSQESDLVSVTVVNSAKPKKTEFPDEDFISGDESVDELSVHRRGSFIIESLSLRNGRFEFERNPGLMVAAYALLECERLNYDETA